MTSNAESVVSTILSLDVVYIFRIGVTCVVVVEIHMYMQCMWCRILLSFHALFPFLHSLILSLFVFFISSFFGHSYRYLPK